MKIVVFTYDRFDSISTPAALETARCDYLVVCHTEEQRRSFIEHGRVPANRLCISGVPKGLANNRNWYLDEMLKDDEWCLMLVDDWLQATELDSYDAYAHVAKLPITTKNSGEWSRRFKTPIGMKQFLNRAEQLCAQMAERRILLGGFVGYENALFRAKHWTHNVLPDGRAIVMQKTSLRFDPNVQMIDDVCFAAQNILYGNGTLVNQWVLPKCKRYTQGAFGSINERMEQKLRECSYLVSTYPEAVTIAPKPGWPLGSHVKLRSRIKRAD